MINKPSGWCKASHDGGNKRICWTIRRMCRIPTDTAFQLGLCSLTDLCLALIALCESVLPGLMADTDLITCWPRSLSLRQIGVPNHHLQFLHAIASNRPNSPPVVVITVTRSCGLQRVSRYQILPNNMVFDFAEHVIPRKKRSLPRALGSVS